MYIYPNFKTKGAFRDALKRKVFVSLLQDSSLGGKDGLEYVEGPHLPEPQTWHARVRVEDGRVVKIVS